MANTKSKKSTNNTKIQLTGFAPVILAAVTVLLVLITGSEIMSCMKLAEQVGKPTITDCVAVEGESIDCSASDTQDILGRTQMQSYHVLITTLIAATMLSASITVSHISLSRK